MSQRDYMPRLAEKYGSGSPRWLMGSAPATQTLINNKRCLYFGGTSYYGLHANRSLMEAGVQAWREFGHGTATSRAGMGTNSLHVQVEQAAAEFFDTDSASYLPSGYLSNLAGLKVLRENHEFDVIFVDEHSHYSVFDAARAVDVPVHPVAHLALGDLEEKLQRCLQPGQRPLVLGDAIFPTLGQIAPAPSILQVLEPYDGLLWLDEAHSLGILGPNGRGIYDHFGVSGSHLLSGGTLAKAFGGFGGVISGSQRFVEQVARGQVVCGASSVPPPLAATTLAGIEKVAANPQWRERLQANARMLKEGVRSLGFEVEDNDLPIAAFQLGDTSSMEHVQHRLMERGIAIQHVHYAGVGAEGALRAVVFSTHTDDQIAQLIDELRRLV